MATNAIYQKFGTAIVFTESGGDAVFSPKSTANAHGRSSAQFDRGSAGAFPMLFKWEAQIKAGSAITISNPVRVYLYASQAAAASVDLSTDADLTVETQLNNFTFAGSVVANANTVGPFYNTGTIFLPGRYLVVAFWNASGQTFTAVNGDSKITLTPIYDDIQAAA